MNYQWSIYKIKVTCTTEIFSFENGLKIQEFTCTGNIFELFYLHETNSACICAGKTPLNWTLIGFVSKRHCHSFCVGRQNRILWTITVKCAIKFICVIFLFKDTLRVIFSKRGSSCIMWLWGLAIINCFTHLFLLPPFFLHTFNQFAYTVGEICILSRTRLLCYL